MQPWKRGFQMAVGGITSTILILQFWKCVLPFVDVQDPIVDCEFAIEAVRPEIDACKLTIDAVLTYLQPTSLPSDLVKRCFIITYGRVR
jgi:hypothetical protein